VKVVALHASARRDGNSRALADAVLEGAAEQGHEAELVHLADHVGAFLRDCRGCRGADGRCAIGDGYEAMLLEKVLPADAVVFATPLYWYGVSAQLKAFFDRIFCYVAASYPDHARVEQELMGKRLALAISSEESYPGAPLGVVHQIQEYARYTHSSLVGVVQGIGNTRGEVCLDPAGPIGRARDLGRRIFHARSTDYRLDTPRSNSAWAAPELPTTLTNAAPAPSRDGGGEAAWS